MKKLRIGLSVLAVAIATGGVFASNAASVNSTDPTFTWQHFDRNGNLIETVPGLTKQQARNQFGCQAISGTECAEAVEDPSQIIYYQ